VIRLATSSTASRLEAAQPRVIAVDAYRGLVMLLLISDPQGAFSLTKVAALLPENRLLGVVAKQFTHAEWAGIHIWDLIMPAFVLLIGISLALSFSARRSRGESESDLLLSGLLRCATFIVLGLILSMESSRTINEILPLLILALGLPWARLLHGRLTAVSAQMQTRLINQLHIAVVAGCAWYFFANTNDIGIYESAHLLVQVGLACLIAYPLLARSNATIVAVIMLILICYWLAFALYSTPANLSHWGKNTNIASAFDLWFFNLLPRTAAFELHGLGLQTLNFVPMTTNILIGVLVGRGFVSDSNHQQVGRRTLIAGALLCTGGYLAGIWLCPVIKNIWTPSFALLSAGLTLLMQGAFVYGTRSQMLRSWRFLLVVIGSNSLLMYVLSIHYRWRFENLANRLLPVELMSNVWAPLYQSIMVLMLFCLLAFMLRRYRLLIKL
jgi:heparan-alpha-glucosaminide N-acetyltransferase